MRRWPAILAALGVAAIAFSGGETNLGTKSDIVSTPTKYDSGPGLAPLFQTILVLGIVLFILKTVGPKIIAKMGKKISTNANGLIKVEESATFAGGSLYVVEARGKSLLLSVSNSGVSCLADLTVAETKPEPALFMDIVADAESRRGEDLSPPHASVYLDEPAVEIPAEPTSLLRNGEIEALRRSAQTLA